MIAIGADHGGFLLKEHLKSFLEKKGIEVLDCGTHSDASCDYPDIAEVVCGNITSGKCESGILICGTGIGMSIASNKIKGIRAACCSDYFSAKYTKAHNNSNVLCLGARVIGNGLAEELTEIYLSTEFEGERHQKRLNKIIDIENKN